MTWKRRSSGGGLAGLLLAAVCFAGRPGAGQVTSTPATAAPAASRTVQGQVVNAWTGSAIARALVTLPGHAALTDAQGQFSFPDITLQTASVMVQKPGYSATLRIGDMQAAAPAMDLDQPLRLVLYPDGLITGTVTGSDGQPLEKLPLNLERAQYDTQGLRPVSVGYAMTDSHGQFRFREPAGRYRLMLRYMPSVSFAQQAVLPVTVPGESASQDEGYFTLAPGEQKQMDLRPAMGTTYKVQVTLEGGQTAIKDGNLHLLGQVTAMGQVTATNAAGDTLTVPAMMVPGGTGETQILLPSGTYQLRSVSQVREQIMEATGRVTVAGHDVSGVVMRVSPTTSLPVEVSFDASSAGSSVQPQAATIAFIVEMLALRLHSVSAAESSSPDLRPMPVEGGGFAFHAPAGRYRLQTSFSLPGGKVESATLGQTDLLTGVVTISGNSGGSPIRIVATNKNGVIGGSVQPASATARTFVYLIAQFPCLTPYVRVTAGRTGTWTASVLPGAWSALAVQHTIEADLHDPTIATRYISAGRSVEVADGGQISVDLPVTDPDAKETP